MIKHIKKLFCWHRYFHDTQLKVMICEKCRDSFFYETKDMFTSSSDYNKNKLMREYLNLLNKKNIWMRRDGDQYER
jgi:hypothetical protein